MSDVNTIPYTHWAYFADQASAEACGLELDLRFDCLTIAERTERALRGLSWLLRASRPVDINTDWHGEVETVVERHGGFYDGGEATYFLKPKTAASVAAAVPREPARVPTTAALERRAREAQQRASEDPVTGLANALGRIGSTVWRIDREDDGTESMQFTRNKHWYGLVGAPTGWRLEFADSDGEWHDFQPITGFGRDWHGRDGLDRLAGHVVEAVDQFRARQDRDAGQTP